MKVWLYETLKRLEGKIDSLTAKVDALRAQEKQNMALLDTLTADVATLTTVDQSAVTLINGLAAQIKAAGTDPVALKALTDQMETQSTALAAAVTANTPVTQNPPPPGP